MESFISNEEKKEAILMPKTHGARMETDDFMLSHEEYKVPSNFNDYFVKKSYDDALKNEEDKDIENYEPIQDRRNEEEKIIDEDEKVIEKKDWIDKKLKRIEGIKENAKSFKLVNYEEDFDTQADIDAIVLAEVDKSELDTENEKITQEIVKMKEEEKEKESKEEIELAELKIDTSNKLINERETVLRSIQKKYSDSIKNEAIKTKKIEEAFSDITKKLEDRLQMVKGKIKRNYNDLSISEKEERHNLSHSIKQGSGNINWKKERPRVKLRIELARCMKDKLPKGRYAILCSILERIGGSSLKYETGGFYPFLVVSVQPFGKTDRSVDI